MKIGAAYIRVSTDDQTELSPDSQLAEIMSYAQRNDIVVPEEYIFIEGEKKKGLSGRKAANRPAFQRMISMAKNKPRPFDCLLLWKFSRFARNIDEATYYKSVLRKKCGVDVISISEPIMQNMYGKLIEMIITWSDEFYSVNLATEVKRGMSSKAKAGEYCAYAPMGYTMVDKKLVINEEQAEIVRWVYETYAAGGKARRMAMELNERGIRTRFGNLLDNRFILYMVSNPVYKGYIVFSTEGRRARGEMIDLDKVIMQKGIHEPIVDEELWQKCYDRYLAEKKLERRESKKHEYATRSLIKCGNCGGTLTYGVNGRLQCCKYARGVCKVSHSMDAVEAEVSVIQQMRLDLLSMDRGAAKTQAKNKKVGSDYETEIKSLRKKLSRIDEAYAAGVYELEEYKSLRKKLTDGIIQMQKAYDESISKEVEIVNSDVIAKLLENYDKLTERERNLALMSIIEKIVAHKSQKGYIFEIFYR